MISASRDEIQYHGNQPQMYEHNYNFEKGYFSIEISIYILYFIFLPDTRNVKYLPINNCSYSMAKLFFPSRHAVSS